MCAKRIVIKVLVPYISEEKSRYSGGINCYESNYHFVTAYSAKSVISFYDTFENSLMIVDIIKHTDIV